MQIFGGGGGGGEGEGKKKKRLSNNLLPCCEQTQSKTLIVSTDSPLASDGTVIAGLNCRQHRQVSQLAQPSPAAAAFLSFLAARHGAGGGGQGVVGWGWGGAV